MSTCRRILEMLDSLKALLSVLIDIEVVTYFYMNILCIERKCNKRKITKKKNI